TNKLPAVICYSNFEEATDHSEPRIHEIDNTENIINSEPSFHRSYSFYDQSTSENYYQESTSKSNIVEEFLNNNL
ncbi:2132_t:CDS:1, partial [Dentiscutata erythropus]